MTSLAYIIISIAIFFKYIFDMLRSYKKATKQLNSLVLLFLCILLCFTTFYGNFDRHLTFDLKKCPVCPRELAASF